MAPPRLCLFVTVFCVSAEVTDVSKTITLVADDFTPAASAAGVLRAAVVSTPGEEKQGAPQARAVSRAGAIQIPVMPMECYAVARLNPFMGMLQVVRTGAARALSADGVYWEIQVLAEQPEHDWRSPNANEPQMRYFRFGAWTAESGLQRVPVSPILDLNRMLAAEQELVALLPEALRQLPFAPGHRFELWLLDPEQRPLALIASTVKAQFISEVRTEPWAACALTEHGFVAPSLLARQIPAHDGHNPRRHAAELERQVRLAAGSPTRQAWFERDEDGAGSVLDDPRRRLAAADFPALLLAEDWPEPAAAALARDYFAWNAPYLLTLPGLGLETRGPLERAAAKRAVLTAALYRLFPEIIDPERLRAVRVEAKLREAADARQSL